ncbi:hypothetical protein HMPREF1248_0510 [Coriobacteriaceae bacterium BV3Ac1]|nr:hypothetical protein HMPREF1248_0510 [Coriobacteriaceae bacterium BV3Ac1]
MVHLQSASFLRQYTSYGAIWRINGAIWRGTSVGRVSCSVR